MSACRATTKAKRAARTSPLLSRVQLATWTDVVHELDVGLAFITSLGLGGGLAGSRFTAFRARIAELAQVLEEKGSAAAFHRFTSEIELNAVALTESYELVNILPYLRSLPPDRAERKLQVALK